MSYLYYFSRKLFNSKRFGDYSVTLLSASLLMVPSVFLMATAFSTSLVTVSRGFASTLTFAQSTGWLWFHVLQIFSH